MGIPADPKKRPLDGGATKGEGRGERVKKENPTSGSRVEVRWSAFRSVFVFNPSGEFVVSLLEEPGHG